jgi:hypothetical protein
MNIISMAQLPRMPRAVKMQLRVTLGIIAAALATLACAAAACDRAGTVLPSGTPSWLASLSLQQHAAHALSDGRSVDALATSAEAIIADPASATPISLLGGTLVNMSRPAEALRAFTVAAARGWRDPATQLYWLAVAIQTRDNSVAAQRLDALLRTGTASQQTAPLLAQMEATSSGRAALAQRMALNPQWAVDATTTIANLHGPALRRRLALLTLARAAGYRPNCAWMRAPTSIIFDRGDFADAADAWHGLCGSGDQVSLLVDGGFEQAAIGRDRVPFDWIFFLSGEAEVQLVARPGAPRGSGQMLSIRSSSVQNVAAQNLVLPAGEYRLTMRAAPGLRVRIDCLVPSGDTPAQGFVLLSDAATTHVFTVPRLDCGAQLLTLQVGIGNATQPLWLDDVEISRANR